MNTTRLSSSYQHGPSSTKIYDIDAMLDMDVERAKGYLVLLRGDGSEDAQRMAFMSLTDGNVVEACLGTNSAKREGTKYYLARQTKNMLVEASEVSTSFPKLAIEAYRGGIETIVKYNDRIERVFFCFRCFVHRGIRRKAKEELIQSFSLLQEAIETLRT